MLYVLVLLAAICHITVSTLTLESDFKKAKSKMDQKNKSSEKNCSVSIIPKELDIVQEEKDDLEAELYCDSLEMLAVCVEAEAGNQGLRGKRLVADVILNRVESDIFPDDIVSVITQHNQFSTYTDGAMDRVVEPSEETIRAVQMELEKRIDTKILYFTAGYYNPYCKPAYKYKDHYFGYQP